MAKYPEGSHGCPGCELCNDRIAEAERRADEAEAEFWAEEDARWNREWARDLDPGEDVQYVDSSWRERPQF